MSKKKNKTKDMPVAGTSNPGVKIEAGVFIDFATTRLSAKDKNRLDSLVAGFQGVYGEREKVINELNALTMQLVLIDGAIEKFRAKAKKKSWKKDRKKVIETNDLAIISDAINESREGRIKRNSREEKKAAKKANKA